MKNYKKGLLISANIIYFFIFLGFVFFTHPNPTILHKYSVANVLGLLGILILAIPYNLLLLFLLTNSLYLTNNKKKQHMHIGYRLMIVLFLLVVSLVTFELFIRMMPKPLVENFHPFLQAINTKENDSAHHVNADNFRYDEITKKKPENTYRIFITGGSTVFDEWHSYEKSLTKQVEDLLREHYPSRKIQVINAGYNRYTSEHTLILYQTKLADYDPDLIVVWQGFNDLYYSCTPDYLSRGTFKSDYSHFYNILANVVNYYFNYTFKLYSIELVQRVFTEKFYADLKPLLNLPTSTPKIQYMNIDFPSLQAYSRNMRYLIKAVKADNVAMLIGNQPNYYTANKKSSYGLAQSYCRNDGKIASPESLRHGMALFNKESKTVADENAVPFVDLESKVPKTQAYFTDDVHYTDKGDKAVAEAVYQAIIENGYLEKQ